jgi:hypothetical protein
LSIRSTLLIPFAAALLGIASVPTVSAQSAQPSADQPVRSYSDSELKSFAEALVELQRINRAYQPRLEAATTPDEKNQVQHAAMEEATQTLAKKGINVDKYNEILLVAQNNPEVAERIRDQLRNMP